MGAKETSLFLRGQPLLYSYLHESALKLEVSYAKMTKTMHCSVLKVDFVFAFGQGYHCVLMTFSSSL